VNDPPERARRIAVIGGGISGLAAAHRLVELEPGCAVTLFEAGPRLGGVLSTVHRDGFQVEQSADNFITTVPYGLELCRRLGLSDQLTPTNPAHRRTYVVCRGRLHPLPEGFMMMAPTRLWPLAVTPILSPWGKLRAALEYFVPPRQGEDDESMASFVRRRLGREAFDRLVEPLVSAVYAADVGKLSVLATLSRFRDMEREHGSLIRAMRRQMKERRKAARRARRDGGGEKSRQGEESGPRYSMFVTLREGLTKLIDALATRLPEGAVRLGTKVERIERADEAWRVWVGPACRAGPASGGRHVAESRSADETDRPREPESRSASGTYIEYDAVILATPSHVSAGLLEPVEADVARQVGSIARSGTAIVSLGYRREQIGHPLAGMGAVVPSVENSPILAVSFSSQKYPHRAPEGKELLRVFLGGARHEELAEMPGDELVPLVENHLKPLLDVRGEPCFLDVAHWPRTMPQYHVGHRELVAGIEARVAEVPGLELAGNAFHGVGIPDSTHGGEQAAERALGSGARSQESGIRIQGRGQGTVSDS